MSERRDIEGYPGYKIDADGVIWSYRRKTIRELTPVRDSSGYYIVSLFLNGKQMGAYVHRLLLMAFSGPCPEDMECRHLDGDRGNYALSNLKWGTRKQNCDDRNMHGTGVRGSRSPSAKLTESKVKSILRLHASGQKTRKQLARKYKVTKEMIGRIVNRVNWKHVEMPI